MRLPPIPAISTSQTRFPESKQQDSFFGNCPAVLAIPKIVKNPLSTTCMFCIIIGNHFFNQRFYYEKRTIGKPYRLYFFECRLCHRLWQCLEISLADRTKRRWRICFNLFALSFGPWIAGYDHGIFPGTSCTNESPGYVQETAKARP